MVFGKSVRGTVSPTQGVSCKLLSLGVCFPNTSKNITRMKVIDVGRLNYVCLRKYSTFALYLAQQCTRHHIQKPAQLFPETLLVGKSVCVIVTYYRSVSRKFLSW